MSLTQARDRHPEVCIPNSEDLTPDDMRIVARGTWNVDDVLRPIYEDASDAVGREFTYPADP